MEKIKYLVVGLVLFALLGGASADTITDYQVPATVPLNQGITASGLFTGTDANADVLCGFLFYDTNSKLVGRASDEYTLGTGRFALPPYEINEPYFSRGQSYRLRTECGGATADANFTVIQKQEALKVGSWYLIPESLTTDWAYWTDTNKSFVVVVSAIILLSLFGMAIIWFYKD